MKQVTFMIWSLVIIQFLIPNLKNQKSPQALPAGSSDFLKCLELNG